MNHDMERSVYGHVPVTPSTQEDLNEDHFAEARASKVARNLSQPQEIVPIRRNEDTRLEGTPSNSGIDLGVAPTSVTGTSACEG